MLFLTDPNSPQYGSYLSEAASQGVVVKPIEREGF